MDRKWLSTRPVRFATVAIGSLMWLLAIPGLHESQATASSEDDYQPVLPPAIPQARWKKLIPQENPMTQAKTNLGKRLFFDRCLLKDDTISGATCHDPQQAYTDGQPVSIGIKGHSPRPNDP